MKLMVIERKIKEYSMEFALAQANGDKWDIIAEGSVKWDGCSNWDFMPERVMLHLCEVSDMDLIKDAIQECYAITAKKLPKWDGE